MSSSFFPTAIYGRGDASFTPLFRMLEDFDSYSKGNNGTVGGRHQRGQNLPTFHPRFDVRETATSYELHGELPGLEKKDVQIEFTDPQTITLRGRVERSYTSGTPPANLLEHPASAQPAAIHGAGHGNKESHRATVEDEDEAARAENAGTEVVAHQSADAKKHHDQAKYWVSERSIGEFSRSFHFQSHVDQDAVKATLKDGVLFVEVPKARKLEGRRIAVD